MGIIQRPHAYSLGVEVVSSIFEGTARRSGNSLVVTITKSIADGLGIKDGDKVKISVLRLGDKEEKS